MLFWKRRDQRPPRWWSGAWATPPTESPRKSRLPPFSPLPMELASGQGLGMCPCSENRRGLAGAWPRVCLPWSLVRRRNRGESGGGSLTQVCSGPGSWRVQAEGKMRLPETCPSFFSAFLSNAIPFRNGLEGEEELGPGLCEFSCWLPQTTARVAWRQTTVIGAGRSPLGEAGHTHWLATAGPAPWAATVTETLTVTLFLIKDKKSC